MINPWHLSCGFCALFSISWGRFTEGCDGAVRDKNNSFFPAGKALFRGATSLMAKTVSFLQKPSVRRDSKERKTACCS
jgi:hypothetical protein